MVETDENEKTTKKINEKTTRDDDASEAAVNCWKLIV
jgi:hypothetical protein